jgi:energy-coupling factor transporter ATP-binding protein EcfA2
MIELQDVSYSYPDSAEPALREVDLSIKEGECILLAGPSGCGKSTLLYLLNGLIPQVLGGDLQGEIRVAGMCTSDTPIPEISRHVGTVFQNPEMQLFMLRVADDVAFGCENLCLDPSETRARVERALTRLSLGSVRDREIHKLSGGQKQRVAIAGALAMGCRVVLLDEPTSDLDENGRDELLSALHDLRRTGHTIVLAEHRLDGLNELVDRVVCLDAGRIISDGPFPRHIPVPRKTRAPHGTAFPVTEMQSVGYSYPGESPVLRDISFSASRGETIAILGPNGSGKTTLLKMLCGVLRPDEGMIVTDGKVNPKLAQLIGKVGHLFQNPQEQLFTESALQEVAFGPKNLHLDVDPLACLDRVGLRRQWNSHPLSLSRGEQQRLAAASVLAMTPDLILLDEPTSGLDQSAWIALMDTVVNQALDRQSAVVFSTHHKEAANAFADRVITLCEGRIADDRIL